MKVISLCFVCCLASHLLWSQEGKPPAQAPTATEEQLRLQIFLDSRQFRPGKLDGYQGDFTDKALQRFSQSSGKSPESIRQEANAEATVSYTEYKIQENDFSYVNVLPETPEEKSKLTFLPYASIGEMVAERYHTDLAYLRRLNQGTDLDTLKAGAVVKVPSVDPFTIETIWTDPKKPEASKETVPASKPSPERYVHIIRDQHVLEVWEGESLLASFPVSVGPPENETPPGEHKITGIFPRPTFRYDKKMLKEGVRGDEAWVLPPGPNSPVGVIWVALSKDGIGIHGTDSPDLIGRNVSSGCIRLSNWDVLTFSKMIVRGTRVVID